MRLVQFPFRSPQLLVHFLQPSRLFLLSISILNSIQNYKSSSKRVKIPCSRLDPILRSESQKQSTRPTHTRSRGNTLRRMLLFFPSQELRFAQNVPHGRYVVLANGLGNASLDPLNRDSTTNIPTIPFLPAYRRHLAKPGIQGVSCRTGRLLSTPRSPVRAWLPSGRNEGGRG